MWKSISFAPQSKQTSHLLRPVMLLGSITSTSEFSDFNIKFQASTSKGTRLLSEVSLYNLQLEKKKFSFILTETMTYRCTVQWHIGKGMSKILELHFKLHIITKNNAH